MSNLSLSLGMAHEVCAVVKLAEDASIPTKAISGNSGIAYTLAKVNDGVAIYLRDESKIAQGVIPEGSESQWFNGIQTTNDGGAWVRVPEGGVIEQAVVVGEVVYHLWFADHMGYLPALVAHYRIKLP